MLSIEERSRVLDELARDSVPENVDLWPALNARISSRKQIPLHVPSRARSAALVALVVAVVVVALGVVPSWTAPEAVSAESILDRAELAASTATTTVTTYHLVMTRQSKDAGSSTSEVWFSGPDRQRTIQQMIGANGAVIGRQDVVFNGPETWIEDTQSGTTRVIHTTGTTWTRPADSPVSTGNVSELLKSFAAKACMAVRLEQAASSVAGQATYVVIAMPRPLGCGPSVVDPSPGPAGEQARIRVNGQPAGSVANVPAQLTIWVDKQSFLPLRIEVRDELGAVVDQSEVTSVQYNQAISDATYAYTPPAGVPVSTFAGGDGADVKRALASTQKQTPTKSP